MGSGVKAVVSRYAAFVLAALALVLGVLLPNMLLKRGAAPEAAKAPVAAPVAKVAAKERSKSSTPLTKPKRKRVGVPAARRETPKAPLAGEKSYYQIAYETARVRFGASSVQNNEVALSMECASGYAVVIWRDQKALTSAEIYLRQQKLGWSAFAGEFFRYASNGDPIKLKGFGQSPDALNCFEP